MTGQRPSFAPGGPTPMRTSVPGTKDEEVDAGDVLPGYGFQGLKVTEVRWTPSYQRLHPEWPFFTFQERLDCAGNGARP